MTYRKRLLTCLSVCIALAACNSGPPSSGVPSSGAGRYLVAPAQVPAKADLVTALGGGNGARAVRVLELYRAGLGPRVLLAGPEGMHSRVKPIHQRWRASYLVGEGIPESAILYEGGARNSWEEAVNALALMRERKLEHVIVVSDPSHLRRLSWVWGKVFKDSGKRFTLVASDAEDWDAAHWWRTSPNAQAVFGEYIKLAYYLVQY